MGSAHVTPQNYRSRRFARPVVGVLVFLLLFTGYVSVTGAYPELVCGLNQASAGHANQDHQDTLTATENDHHNTTHDQNISVSAKSDNPSCGCEACRNYFNGHLNGLISVLSDSAPFQNHLTFVQPPKHLFSVTTIPATPPPQRRHA